MPISDGFEACKNILKIYNKNQLLKVEKQEERKLNMQSGHSDGEKVSSGVSNLDFFNNKDYIPLMIACSSENLTPKL
jgi:hypothetical protein